MSAFWRRHRSTLVNLLLFICLGNYSADQARAAYLAGRFDFVETAFAVHNIIFLTMILIRRRHQDLDENVWHQALALCAFFSGLLFVTVPNPEPRLLAPARWVIFCAIVLGGISLLNLGRSFGILIALRQVRTGGLYAFIRHPMYFTDILWRVGLVLKNPAAINFLVFVVSSACYVYRALLEERFLEQRPEYRAYMDKVRYRFLPGVY